MFSPALILIVFIVGVLIGGVGIGGVLLVPSLKYLGGIPLQVAIPACMMAYIITGLVGAVVYARHGTINWSLAIKVCLGALPGAYFGAYLLPYVPDLLLEITIGILILASGFYALYSQNGIVESGRSATSSEMISVGLITGIGSSLTGTGGPLLLIPLLIWRKQPVLTAVGLSQAVQVPISLMATLGNIIHAEVDFRLGVTLALVLAVGALLGAKSAHLMPVGMIKNIVSGLLIGVGLTVILRMILRL